MSVYRVGMCLIFFKMPLCLVVGATEVETAVLIAT